MADARRRRLADMRSGDHIIVIYEETAELLTFAVPFIKEGLVKRERCIYVADDLRVDELTDALAAGGVDVSREIERGALVLMNAKEYSRPPFDPMRMVDLMRERVREAGSHEFSRLRVAAEMTWTLATAVPEETLVEYESLIDQVHDPTLTLACAYRRGRFSAALLQRVVRTHTKVIAGDQVYMHLSGLFQELTPTDVQALLASAQERRVPKGGFYYQQGDPAREVFVLTSGRVKTIRTDADGRSVTLRLVTPPESFGHISALGNTRRLAAAQAWQDSRALVLDAPKVLEVIVNHPEVSLNAVHLMANHLAEEFDRVQDLATSPIERRFARLLLRLAHSMGRRTPPGVAIELGLVGQDLAELINTTPYTVSRTLAGWRRLNLIEVQRERVLLLNQKRLAAIAGEPGAEDPTKVGRSKPAQADKPR